MLKLILKIGVGCLLVAHAHAELVVIVNPQNGVEQLSKTQITNIFLGNHREFPDGMPAKPVDLPVAAPEKALFYRALVNKDLDQMAAYWSRLVFAGNTSPRHRRRRFRMSFRLWLQIAEQWLTLIGKMLICPASRSYLPFPR